MLIHIPFVWKGAEFASHKSMRRILIMLITFLVLLVVFFVGAAVGLVK
jgi:hypothetical protein